VARCSAFAAGSYLGGSRNTVVITDGAQGESYSGGFRVTEEAPVPGRRSPGGEMHMVKDGESIQDAVNAASPGDTIRIMPGTYSETVYIDKDGIRLIGVIEEGNWPTLEGERRLNDASSTRATTSSSRTSRSPTTRAMRSWGRPATTSRSATT
jgi:pectin methylesterase-like acyl-CoA thioesterase